MDKSGLKDMHRVCVDGPRRTNSIDAPNTRSALPNDLGEVRILRVFGVIVFGFIHPPADRGGDGVRSPSSQVLCKI